MRKFEGKMLTRIDFVCFVDFPGLIMTKRQVFVFGFLPCKTMYSVNKQNVTNHNYQVRRNKHSGTRHVFYTLEKIFIRWIGKQIFYISSHSLSSFVLFFIQLCFSSVFPTWLVALGLFNGLEMDWCPSDSLHSLSRYQEATALQMDEFSAKRRSKLEKLDLYHPQRQVI